MPQIFVLPRQTALDEDANPMSGALAYFYRTGTTTPQAVYADAALSVPLSNPVEADSAGRFPKIFLDTNASFNYRVRVTTALGLQIYQEDDIDRFTVSQQEIARAFYPRTASEIAEDITPSNYAYPEGHVRRYGVTFSGSDESASLQLAANYCELTGVPIKGDVGTVTVASTLVLNCTGDLSMMTVSVNSTLVSPAVRVGMTSGGPLQLNGRLRMPKVVNASKPGTGWASQQVGVWLANLYQSEIYVPYVRGFNVGLDCGGVTSGFSYNNIFLGEIFDNKVGVKLQGKNANTGWANQNQFYGGRVWIDSGEGTAISGARFVLLTPFDVGTTAGTSWPNGNTFVGTTFESDEPEYQAEISGNNNVFVNCRWEAASPAVLLTGHASGTDTYENMIVGGYNSSEITFTSSGIVRYSAVVNSRSSSIGGSGVTMNLHNQSSGDDPIFQMFDASQTYLGKTSAATDWTCRISATGLKGKQSADTNPRVAINFFTGAVTFANGPYIVGGSGSPEGVWTAPIGSLFLRTDGTTSTTLYVKESGTGNTGWRVCTTT